MPRIFLSSVLITRLGKNKKLLNVQSCSSHRKNCIRTLKLPGLFSKSINTKCLTSSIHLWNKHFSLMKKYLFRTNLHIDVRLNCSIPGSGRPAGEGNGNPLQYSCWRIPWVEEHGYNAWGRKESDFTVTWILLPWRYATSLFIHFTFQGVNHVTILLRNTSHSPLSLLWTSIDLYVL